MTTNQAVITLAGLMIALIGFTTGFMKYYIDAKVDPIAKDVKLLVDYMISHEGRISRLEERTK